MIRECDICKKEQEEKWMQSFNTGRRTIWLCWECYQQSQREATQSDKFRQRKLYKISESKKRNK